MENFKQIASKFLDDLYNEIIEKDIDSNLDIDFDGEVLTIISSKGIYVINLHNAAREIWVASPVSGPKHFAYKDATWIDSAEYNLTELIFFELFGN